MAGALKRIGLAIAPTSPDTVYAIIEAADDEGETPLIAAAGRGHAAAVKALLAAGAAGYVLKQAAAEDLIGAIRIVAAGGLHQREGVGAVPGMAIDERPTVGSQCALQPQESIVSPRRAHALGAAHPHETVTANAVRSDHCGR